MKWETGWGGINEVGDGVGGVIHEVGDGRERRWARRLEILLSIKRGDGR
jgi:hypothetical protein